MWTADVSIDTPGYDSKKIMSEHVWGMEMIDSLRNKATELSMQNIVLLTELPLKLH